MARNKPSAARKGRVVGGSSSTAPEPSLGNKFGKGVVDFFSPSNTTERNKRLGKRRTARRPDYDSNTGN